MPFSVLSADTQSQLEHERARLIDQRDTIIEAAVAQATADVDHALHQLDQLLGTATSEPAEPKPAKSKSATRSTSQSSAPAQSAIATETAAPASKVTPKAKPAASTPKPASKVKAKPAAPASKTTPKAKATPANKATAPASKSPASAQPLALKREFKSGTPTEAVKQIMHQAGKPLTTDEVIQALYQSVKGDDLSTARKSVALILGRGAYQGIYEKVQENPSRFQIKA